MKPQPPSPLIQGSTAPTAKPVAMAASTALPPAARIAAPAAAARRLWLATIPPEPVTAGLRRSQGPMAVMEEWPFRCDAVRCDNVRCDDGASWSQIL